jgi:hypothetical protein
MLAAHNRLCMHSTCEIIGTSWIVSDHVCLRSCLSVTICTSWSISRPKVPVRHKLVGVTNPSVHPPGYLPLCAGALFGSHKCCALRMSAVP